MVLEKTEECIFCKIAQGEIPTEFVFENDQVVAFRDIHPQAPVHILIIPRKHIPKIGELNEEDAALFGHLNQAATEIAKQMNIYEDGYRLVINSGNNGGQTVYHLHVHLLGGRVMRWPPG